MGVQKKTRKFAQVKRAIGLRDSRLCVVLFLFQELANNSCHSRKENQPKNETKGNDIVREM